MLQWHIHHYLRAILWSKSAGGGGRAGRAEVLTPLQGWRVLHSRRWWRRRRRGRGSGALGVHCAAERRAERISPTVAASDLPPLTCAAPRYIRDRETWTRALSFSNPPSSHIYGLFAPILIADWLTFSALHWNARARSSPHRWVLFCLLLLTRKSATDFSTTIFSVMLYLRRFSTK